MIALLGMALFLIGGWFLLRLINFSGWWYEKLALGFLVMSGIVNFTFFIFAQLTDKATSGIFWILTLVFCLLFICLSFVKSRKEAESDFSFDFNLKSFPKPVILFWSAILALTLITLTYAAYFPVFTTDSLHLYDFRAKVMYETRTLSSIAEYVQAWSTYPPYTSIINLFMRYLGLPPSVFYPFMYLSFAVIFYAQLRRHTNSIISSMGTLLMYSTPLIMWQSRLDGLTNLPYTIFFNIGIFYFLLAINKRLNWSYFFVSIIMMALSNWTRINEPFWVIPIMLFVLRYRKKIEILPVILVYFHLAKLPNTIWTKFVRSSSHVDLSKGSKVLIEAITSSSYLDSNTVALSPADTPFSNMLAILEQASRHLSLTIEFLSTSIVSSLTPVIFIFPLILTIHIFYGHTAYARRVLLCILFGFLILWAGTIYASLQFSYWLGLGNAVGRISGFIIPLMWLYIFQLQFWKQLSWPKRL